MRVVSINVAHYPIHFVPVGAMVGFLVALGWALSLSGPLCWKIVTDFGCNYC